MDSASEGGMWADHSFFSRDSRSIREHYCGSWMVSRLVTLGRKPGDEQANKQSEIEGGAYIGEVEGKHRRDTLALNQIFGNLERKVSGHEDRRCLWQCAMLELMTLTQGPGRSATNLVLC